jgi:hypothetical protein
LDQIAPPQAYATRGKVLPARPDSGEGYEDDDIGRPESEDGNLEENADSRATMSGRTANRDERGNMGSYSAVAHGSTHVITNIRHDPISGLVSAKHDDTLAAQTSSPQLSFSRDATQGLRSSHEGGGISTVPANLQLGDHRQHLQQYMSPLLSPRHEYPNSPGRSLALGVSEAPPIRSNFSVSSSRSPLNTAHIGGLGHLRGESNESASWLDPHDEIYGSGDSSVHSRSSSMRIRRKHIGAPSSSAVAEFDAALDAAVEAAYDDGFESTDPIDVHFDLEAGESDDEVRASLREARLAKEQLQEAEAADSFHQHASQVHHTHQLPGCEAGSEPYFQDFYDDNSSDDGDRVSAEILRDIDTKGSVKGQQNNAPPAQQKPAQNAGVSVPRPPSKNDFNPQTNLSAFTTSSCDTTVLSRRLSGQHVKQLKIETSAKFGAPNQIFFAAEGEDLPSVFKTPSSTHDQDVLRAVPKSGAALVSPRSISPGPKPSPSEIRQPNSPVDGAFIDRHDIGSPLARRPSLHKNYSSSSLRSIKGRKMSLSNLDDSDLSPGTPSSNPFNGAAGNRLPILPILPTPLVAAFNHNGGGDIGTNPSTNRVGNGAISGMYLFDDNLHSPNVPGSPNLSVPGGPVPLEACPTEFTFRPFWLMRCIYQTLAHPRGGYISTRLFIPRDVWKVKGVKLKNVEDKIASCDLLTAALLKLSRVDNNDADAVLEEMQALEAVLDQVQANLVRRLGNEVGPQSSGFMSSGGPDTELSGNMPRSSSVSNKSSSFSWKRLRSKNSAAGLGSTSTSGPRPLGPDAVVDMLAPTSLPMTTNPTRRPPKRDFHQVQFTGPNASYMTSLAQLFDAVQAIGEHLPQILVPRCRAVQTSLHSFLLALTNTRSRF